MRLPRAKKRPRMELLALMDVVFLILVFLVYAMLSMVRVTGMPVNLPEARSGQAEQETALAVSVRGDGSIWLDKCEVSLEDLPQALRRLAPEDGREPPVQVFADASLPCQRLYAVLEGLKMAGIRKISLQASLDGS